MKEPVSSADRITRDGWTWKELLTQYHGDKFGSCATCGAPFAKGCSCPHCTDQSPHVSQADKIKYGYPLQYFYKKDGTDAKA